MTALVDHVHYNGLPSLAEANASLNAAGPQANDLINGALRQVFIKHNAHRAFCLYLQHRHHTIDVDEAVIKVNGSAHLLGEDDIKDIVSFGNKVVPTTWMTAHGGLMLPMEFSIVPEATNAPAPPTPEFFSDFLAIIALNHCEGLFGIDTLAKSAWMEMSIGHASVVIPSNGNSVCSDELESKFIPVAFEFEEEKPKFKVHGRCGKNHRHTSKPAPVKK